jgi:prepilin-type N-terminal cleavage/methylation domain-containing protein
MTRLYDALRRRLREGGDRGFTLVELLVATALSVMVGGMVVATLITAQVSTGTTTANADLNAEARDLLNRLTGDLRQATPLWKATTVGGSTVEVETPAITAVQNPSPGGSANAVTSITFDADYSGDGCVDGVVSDNCPGGSIDVGNPEIETFCWDPTLVSPTGATLVYLIPGGVQSGTCTPSLASVTAQPLLSGNVTGLQIYYDSNRYLYDTDHDGVTTWQELDAQGPPIGNADNALNLPELNLINSIKLVVTLSEGAHTQTYQAVVFLRNVQ